MVWKITVEGYSGMRRRRREWKEGIKQRGEGGRGRGGRRKKKKRRDRYELRNIIGLSYDRDCVVSV